MKNLLYKELALAIPKSMYLFALMPGLLLAPSYPYIVVMGYVILAIFTVFNGATAVNRDLQFAASLPVKRSDIVLSKLFTVLVFEGLTLLAAIPFALLSSLAINRRGNLVGLDANVAFFGCTLIEYGVFNVIFLPLYFRTGYKAGVPALLGLAGYAVAGAALELLIQLVPGMRVLDSLEPAHIVYQLPVLAVGLVIFIVALFGALAAAVKTFERVDL